MNDDDLIEGIKIKSNDDLDMVIRFIEKLGSSIDLLREKNIIISSINSLQKCRGNLIDQVRESGHVLRIIDQSLNSIKMSVDEYKGKKIPEKLIKDEIKLLKSFAEHLKSMEIQEEVENEVQLNLFGSQKE